MSRLKQIRRNWIPLKRDFNTHLEASDGYFAASARWMTVSVVAFGVSLICIVIGAVT